MCPNILSSIAVLLCFTAALAAQQSEAAAAPAEPAIRVDVNLIQIDVTVTDRSGKRTPGLTPDDFEVTVDGKKQPLQNALWVGKQAGSPVAPNTPAATPSTTVAGPRQLTRQQVRRTVALLVDDESLSPGSITYTRESIRKFVQASLQPGDFVAIFRTSSGMSLMTQFSADREKLLADIDRLRLGARNPLDVLGAIRDNPDEGGGEELLIEMARRERLREEIFKRQAQDFATAAMLGSMTYLVRGMRDLPGRKSLILFSESVQLFDAPQIIFNPEMSRASQRDPGAQGGPRSRTLAGLDKVTDLANRSGVSIYAIDPRGAVNTGLTAEDSPANIRRAMNASAQRHFEFTSSQEGMQKMADDTGGQFFKGTNDITSALRDAVDDQEEYYLLAFAPDSAFFEKAKVELASGNFKMHRIQVKIKRQGLQVRHRKSFFGVPDKDMLDWANPEAQRSPLLAVMLSPFRAVDVPVRMTPLFSKAGNASSKKSTSATALRVMVQVEASKLTFADAPGGFKTASIDFAVCLFDESNRMVAKSAQKQDFRLRGESLEAVRRDGIVEQLVIPLPRAGGSYHLRAAIIDTATGLTGSAAQFLQTPDLGKGELESSDLIINVDGWKNDISERGSPARRIFRPGDRLNYEMMIYNARTSPKTRTSVLETQIALYRDGKRVLTSPRSPVNVPEDEKEKDVNLSGSVNLSQAMPPGTYIIEVTVRDPLAPKKQQFTLRAMDFELRAN